MAAHKCERFTDAWRGHKRCRTCNRAWFQVAKGEWRPTMSLKQFGEKWLPAVSGTKPENMMYVQVAFPFEWNCYESWNIVYRVKFEFTDVLGRREGGLRTRIDVMNGWQSKYHEDFCRIDYEAERYYEERTGRSYDIGDNTYEEMRQIIQS